MIASHSIRVMCWNKFRKIQMYMQRKMKLLKFWEISCVLVINNFSHRPINVDWRSLKIKRIMFSIIISQNLLKSDLVINVDEWSVSRDTKYQKSWSLKGIDTELKSIVFSSSISLISCISSQGWHFNHIHNSTINTEKLLEFFRDLIKFIKAKKFNKNRRLVLIMDNAAIHKS